MKMTLGQIGQLIEINAACDDFGDDVQELIRRRTAGGVVGAKGKKGKRDPRWKQAKRYWDLGIGRALGFASFKDYLGGDSAKNLAPIPEIPAELLADDPALPYLVLVEPRIGLTKLCQLGNIKYDGDDETLVPYDDRYVDPKQPFWIRVQDGRKNRNMRPSDCRVKFEKDELGLTAPVGICVYLQHPGVLTDLNQGNQGHAMDLLGSVRRDDRGDFAFLLLEDGIARLNWNWNDSADPQYGSASRRECKN
jgi:hypothetical protein